MPGRIVHLEVNDSGAWRRVSSFDLDTFEEGTLEWHAQSLLELSSNPRLTARIIIPGDTAPLVTWSREGGWREWGKRGQPDPARNPAAGRARGTRGS